MWRESSFPESTRLFVVNPRDSAASAIRPVHAEKHSVLISRTPAEQLQPEMAVAEHYWLSETPGEGRVHPSSLSRLISIAKAAAEKGHTIILEGVEYLCLFSSFTQVLRTLCRISEEAHDAGCTFLIVVYEGAMDEREISLIARTCYASLPAEEGRMDFQVSPRAEAAE